MEDIIKYDLTEVPEGDFRWSGKDIDIPEIGTKVKITFNKLGTGTVEGYFVEHGYIGLKVVLDDPPEWHKKQNPGRGFALVFGAEIKLV